jgi:hypothetical protein
MIKKFIEYIKESYIDKDGNLQDFSFELLSDDLISDEKFLEIVQTRLEFAEEMPKKMYDILSDKHKKMYRNELLEYGAVNILYSENTSVLRDLVINNYNKMKEEIEYFMEIYKDMGSTGIPMSEEFIENTPDDIQIYILDKIQDTIPWEVEITKKLYDSFTDEVKDFIKKFDTDPFFIV